MSRSVPTAEAGGEVHPEIGLAEIFEAMRRCGHVIYCAAND
jgi:hypothetical protein